jgi:radical SAM/Cys-rich protein
MESFAESAFSCQLAQTAPEGLWTERFFHTMQLNIIRACNLRCKHCHVSGAPENEGVMSRATMVRCIRVFRENGLDFLDITGGAPELNPDLPWLLAEAAAGGTHPMVRTNLVILEQEGYRHFPELFRECGVEVVGSLPYYTEKDTDKMRGAGVFAASLNALRRLNELGYGSDPALRLNLVYNPGGAFLPPPQETMESEYRRHLTGTYGITFNSLFALTNSPLGRFAEFLERSGNLVGYQERLQSAFNPATVPNMMCRRQLSVDWAGLVYDCDFNQALNLTVSGIHDIAALVGKPLERRRIRVGDHCYACTAGSGSSCGGTTA